MTIWAILDDRIGNANQVLGLVKNLDLPYEEKKIAYNFLAKLPNVIRGKTLLGIKNAGIIKAPYPKLVITAGRKSAPIARYIKSKSHQTQLIQIMSPDFAYQDFSLIILPHHDQPKKHGNIVTTIGSLHQVNQQVLQLAAIKWQKQFSHLAKPQIAIFIGGATKGRVFTKENAHSFAMMINNMACELKASLLITSSRRTDPKTINYLLQKIVAPYYYYDFNNMSDNPYLAYLALADFLVVTGDSISMISECCSTAKPVFIYVAKNMMSKKHQEFTNYLFANSYAKKLLGENNILSFKPNLVLDETKRIAKIVLPMLK